MNYNHKYFRIFLISLLISIIAGGSYLIYPKDSPENPQEIARKTEALDKTKKKTNKYYVKAYKQYKTAKKSSKNSLYNAVNEKRKVDIEKYFTSFCNDDEILVKLKNNADRTAVAVKYDAKISNRLDNYNYILLKLKAGVNKEKIIEVMKRDPVIKSAKSCIHYKAQSIPNDTYYNQQWGLQMIQGQLGHDIESLSNVKVAVVDTGVDMNHQDLKGKLVSGYDVVKKSSRVTDHEGHGTHVAGIIGAVTNNSIGISGLTTKIKIMPVGIFHYEGSAGAYLASEDHIAQGIDWARRHGADIINLSLGGGENSPLVEAAVKRAVRAGITVVAAAGNDGYRKLNYPAALPDVIAVGATNQGNSLAEFSNYGPEIDVVAPGVEIRSTFPTMGGMYLTTSGTSMAAPFVSGLAAMIKGKYPKLTPKEIKYKIQAQSIDLGNPGWDDEYGAGLINVNQALGGKPVKPPKPIKGDDMEPNNTPSTSTAVKYPISIATNKFSPASDVDWLKFRGVKGRSIIISLKTNLNWTFGANGVLELYRDGHLTHPIRASNNSDNGTEVMLFTFPDNGTYYLKVFDLNDHIYDTDYKLDITNFNPLPIKSVKVSANWPSNVKKHQIKIAVSEKSELLIRVYRGKKFIKKIYNGRIENEKSFYWDGTNSSGKRVSKGLYNYRIIVKDKRTDLQWVVRPIYFNKRA